MCDEAEEIPFDDPTDVFYTNNSTNQSKSREKVQDKKTNTQQGSVFDHKKGCKRKTKNSTNKSMKSDEKKEEANNFG